MIWFLENEHDDIIGVLAPNAYGIIVKANKKYFTVIKLAEIDR